MKLVLTFVVFFSIVLLFNRCVNKNETELYSNICDTTNLTFSNDIKPILQANCYVCHAASIQSGGFNMEDFNEIVKRLNSGLLINAINRKDGYPQMPKFQDKLPACIIAKITAWNNAGHPQN